MFVANHPFFEIIKIINEEGDKIIVDAGIYNTTGEEVIILPASYPVTFTNREFVNINFTVKSKIDNSDVPFERSADGWSIIVNDGPELGIIVESID